MVIGPVDDDKPQGRLPRLWAGRPAASLRPRRKVPGRPRQTGVPRRTRTVSGLLLGGLEVRVRAARVVGRVDDRENLGDRRLDRDLDPLAQRDVDLSAALAASAHLDVGNAVAYVEEVDVPAVSCDAGVDLPVEDLLDPRREGIGPPLVRVVNGNSAARRRVVKVDRRAAELLNAGRVDIDAIPIGLDDEVERGRVGGLDEPEVVGEA